MPPFSRELSPCLFASIFLSATSILCGTAWSAEDPFVGDWQGEGIVAQVIPLGKNAYQVILLPKFDEKCEPFATITAHRDGDLLRFEQDGYSGAFRDKMCQGMRRVGDSKVTFSMGHVTRPSPTLGAKPPADAIILFDGSGFDQWQVRGSDDPTAAIAWKIIDHAMQVAPDRPRCAATPIAGHQQSVSRLPIAL